MLWLAALAALTALAGAQQPRMDDVVARVDRYLAEYGHRLENVVTEETYRQRAMGGPGLPLLRVLHSDYALTFVGGRDEWVSYRDTFEVDGLPVRDRQDRLSRLLAAGDVEQAVRIDQLNARYNLATDRFIRTINVPTMALELLQPRYRKRFSVRRIGSTSSADRPGWVLEFRERSRPTIVRTTTGKNQESRIELLVDPGTGDVLRSTISWEHTKGSIVVEYGRVEGIPVLVPATMVERFVIGIDDELHSEATYANYRMFQTSGRVIAP